MSNEWEDQEQQDTSGVAALRKAYKNQKKELEELRKQMENANSRSRVFDINEALASRGLDPRVSKFYPKDSPTDETAIASWIEENHELFGYRQAVDDEGAVNKEALTLTEMRGYEIQKDIAAFENAVQMDFASRVKAAENPAEVTRLLQEYGSQLPMNQ